MDKDLMNRMGNELPILPLILCFLCLVAANPPQAGKLLYSVSCILDSILPISIVPSGDEGYNTSRLPEERR